MDYYKMALEVHKKNRGKIEVISKVPLETRDDLSVAYTPGVAAPCLEINKDESTAYDYTSKGNMVAIVSDGTAVLGLGDIGPKAAIPVMEGKALLFKHFAGVDAFPICLDTKDTEEIIRTVKYLAPVFGGVNLEDIAAPRCFEIEERLTSELDIPIFHDDQHGTAIVTSAAVINALKLTGRDIATARIIVNGVGAAGTAIIRMLHAIGARNIVAVDRQGVLNDALKSKVNTAKQALLTITNPPQGELTLVDAMIGADVFIGVSVAKALSPEMVKTMNADAIVFAMANPEPEIMPDLAFGAGAKIVGTGRSDFPNQINNVLVFPGVFKGALSARATKITEAMKVAAAHAIANTIDEKDLGTDFIIPSVFDTTVAERVAQAVEKAWKEDM